MILFLADNHYGARPGRHLFDALGDTDIRFFEDDAHVLSDAGAMRQCRLLILCLFIEAALPREAEANVKAFLKRGGHVLLLHHGSAAFEQWDWWRPLTGLRWVRQNDPGGAETSVHPVRPYRVMVTENSHPLSGKLRALDLPEDEIYILLQQTCPGKVLMETETDEGVFPQCCEVITPWGGRIVSVLPGHAEEVVTHPDLIYNIRQIIGYLTLEEEN